MTLKVIKYDYTNFSYLCELYKRDKEVEKIYIPASKFSFEVYTGDLVMMNDSFEVFKVSELPSDILSITVEKVEESFLRLELIDKDEKINFSVFSKHFIGESVREGDHLLLCSDGLYYVNYAETYDCKKYLHSKFNMLKANSSKPE